MNLQLRQKFDRITNTLWAGGVTNPITYIEQLSYLLYLKLLDEEESNREKLQRLKPDADVRGLLFPQQASRYRWQNWRFKSGNELRDYLRDEVFPYMSSLVREDVQVAEYFKDATLEIVDPNVLKLIIDEIDTIEFKKLGPDVKGDIFEYFLSHLGQSALNGQFRTPKQIRSLMVQMIDPRLGDSIYDPVCGTGGFLIDSVDHILAAFSSTPEEVPIYGDEWLDRRSLTLTEAKSTYDLQTYRKGSGELVSDWSILENSIYGVDVSRQMMRIAMMNLVLHGIRKAHLKRANSLSELGGLSDDDLKRRYDVILSNPPFAGILPKDSIRSLPTSSTKSELLFLALMMQALAPGGRCGVVVPEGLLFGSTRSHIELRRKLVEEFDLQAVISLPVGVFKPYAGVKTTVLIFRRPLDERPSTSSSIWFADVKNDGYDTDKIQSGGRVENPERNDIPEVLRAWRSYADSGFSSPPGTESPRELSEGESPPKYWWVSREIVAQNDFNLTADRYKPQPPMDQSGDPADIILEQLVKMEGELLGSLNKLRQSLSSSAGDIGS